MKKFLTGILVSIAVLLAPATASALSETVRMGIGETRTLAPAELPSKVLAGQPAWTSSRPGDVQVVSSDMYTCTIKALKSFSGYALVQCRYYYRELDPVSGQYIYQRQGYVNYNVFVEGSEPRSITIYPTSVTMDLGDILTMQVTVLPADADQTVTWTTTDFSVANVNTAGILGASNNGTATVTATTVNGLRASCVVTVGSSLAPVSVSLQQALTITEGGSATLTPVVSPAGAVTGYTWKSGNTAVATVDSRGKVTGVAPGMTSVTVTTSNGRQASCTVTVKERPGQPGSVSLPARISLLQGFSRTLSPVLLPSGSETGYTWTSSDPSVASVNASGKVTAVSAGECTVSVKTSNGLSAGCLVNVQEPDPDLSSGMVMDALARIRELEEKTKEQF